MLKKAVFRSLKPLLVLAVLSLSMFTLLNPTQVQAADPLTWTGIPTGTNALRSVAWSPELNLFVAGGNSVLLTSPDGITWTPQTLPGDASTKTWSSVAWSPQLGLFVAMDISNVGDPTLRAMTSPDGINWTLRSTPFAPSWRAVTWSPQKNLFVAVSGFNTGKVITSPDGINWTSQPVSLNGQWSDVVWSPERNLFVVVGDNPTQDRKVVITSPDGINWSAPSSVIPGMWTGITWSPELGLFAAVANEYGAGYSPYRVMTSPDGNTWTPRTALSTEWKSITWSPELHLFVAVSSRTFHLENIMTSPDGITWTTQDGPQEQNPWWDVTWSPELGIFVAVGSSLNRVLIGAAASAVPGTPTTLTATAAGATKVNLSWTAPANPNPEITGYKIERKTGAGSWSPLVANTGNTNTTYQDTTASPNTTYTYRVSAINDIGTGDPSNEASATTTQPSTDMQITKTATTDSGGALAAYVPGEPFEYVLSVKNNGPDNAGVVTVTDTLPAGIVPTQAAGGGWTCNINSQTVTCTRPSLNNTITAPAIIIDTSVASSVTGAKPNNATVSVVSDPNLSNNNSSITLNPAPKADLSITKEDTTGTTNPPAGSQFDYKFTVKNNGPSDTPSYTITDTLPSSLSYISGPTVCSSSSGTNITCNDTGGLTDGQTKIITVTVKVDEGYNPANPISNTGTVGVPTGVTDPVLSNNSSTATTDVDTVTDLSINKTHTDPFTAGDPNNFAVTVTNNGPSTSPANTVTVTDTLPEGLTFASAAGTGWDCSGTQVGATTITCSYTSSILSTASSNVLTLTVNAEPDLRAAAPNALSNTAEVSSTTPDPQPNNNSHTDTPVTVTGEAEVVLTKTHAGTNFTAGQQGKYNFSIVNNGPSADTPTFTVTDTLPANMTYVTNSATGDATCSAVGQSLTCTGGAIAVGETVNFTITVDVGSSLSGNINNTATLTLPADTTNTAASNTSMDTVNVIPQADLAITKAHTGNMTAGKEETYTITVHNNGPGAASSFTVKDVLETGVSFVPGSGTGATCSATNQTVTCNSSGALASGGDANITFKVKPNPGMQVGGTIENTATVSTTAAYDPDDTNNDSSIENTIEASADLSITKTNTPSSFVAGEDGTFTITVTNNGPSNAADFTVTDTLPAGLTFSSVTEDVADCNQAGQTMTCVSKDSLNSGDSAVITLKAMVGAGITGGTSLTNNVSVASSTPDPTPGNNSDSDSPTILSHADLSVAKDHQGTFTAGSEGTYVIQVSNAGPSNASSFELVDTLDSNITSVETVDGAVCDPPDLQQLVCFGGPIAAGDTVTVTLNVMVSGSLLPGGVLTNTAEVDATGTTFDPDPSNNTAVDTSDVENEADIEVTKSNAAPFIAGTEGQYTITVKNNGPSDLAAGDITITDDLPAGIDYLSASTGWTCNGTGVIICTNDDPLASSGTSTLTLNVQVDEELQGDVVNTAEATSTIIDPNLNNNDGTDTTTIEAQADLIASKNAITPEVTAGQPITYSFRVENPTGPSVAHDVKIVDDLGSQLTYQSDNSDDWDCVQNGTVLTCDYTQPLNIGEIQTVEVTMLVAQDAPNPLVNSASVSFNGTDPTPADAEPGSSVPINYSADLEVDISHEQKTYHGGDDVVFDFTIQNHGPSAADDVVMTADIPEGLDITSVNADAPGGGSILSSLNNFFFPKAHAATNPFSCSVQGNKLVCTASKLFVGTYHLFVTGKIANNFSGNMVLSASITSSTPDPNLNDTTASDTIFGILASSARGPGGLVNTGQNLLVIAGVAIGILILLFRLKPWKKDASAA